MNANRDQEDFSLLVDDLRRRGVRAPERPQQDRLGSRLRVGLVVAALCVLALLIHFAPTDGVPGLARVRSDLMVLLEKSRMSVENGRSQDGRLPPVLPDPACARLVTYTVNGAGDAYELRAGYSGMTMTWNSLVPERFEEYLW